MVALRKESVDRNNGVPYSAAIRLASLSARRAWIEILCAAILSALACVALRKESVDRNTYYIRRFSKCCFVALRKESVDRNGVLVVGCTQGRWRRSPQGERG